MTPKLKAKQFKSGDESIIDWLTENGLKSIPAIGRTQGKIKWIQLHTINGGWKLAKDGDWIVRVGIHFGIYDEEAYHKIITQKTKKVIQGDLQVSYKHSKQTKEDLFDAVVNWFLLHECFDGQSLRINTPASLDAQNLLCNICDKILQMKTEPVEEEFDY